MSQQSFIDESESNQTHSQDHAHHDCSSDQSDTLLALLKSLKGTLISGIHEFGSLIAAIACLVLFALVSFNAYNSLSLINSWIAYFWLVIAIALPLSGFIRFSYTFFKNTYIRLQDKIDPNAAIICSVEVCMNNETVLTVRSWWPVRMPRADVERHGVRVAMSSANRWLADNSQPGGKIIRVRFDESTAVDFCRTYICDYSADNSAHQCSVCLEDIESQECASMKRCGHNFHADCLASWFAQSSRLACPMCRCDHHSLVPQAVYMQHVVKEEPSVSVLTVVLEEGSLTSQ